MITTDTAIGQIANPSARRTDSDAGTSRVDQVRSALGTASVPRSVRLLRLQGWRSTELAAAIRAGNAHRAAPAICAALAWVVVVTASVPIAIFALSTAIVGVVASNHPAELAFNAVARRAGRPAIPANRAAKRLGCLIGAVSFGAATFAFAVGLPLAGRVVMGVMAVVATFVAATNVCVPSIIFTLMWGADRATATSLIAAAKRSDGQCPIDAVRPATWVPVEGYRG
jgi:hypothetical protein